MDTVAYNTTTDNTHRHRQSQTKFTFDGLCLVPCVYPAPDHPCPDIAVRLTTSCFHSNSCWVHVSLTFRLYKNVTWWWSNWDQLQCQDEWWGVDDDDDSSSM